MTDSWHTTCLTSVQEACQVLLELRGKRWLCRGQSKQYGALIPSIDREAPRALSRVEKLTLERHGINLFRSTVRFFSDPGEKNALLDDVVALMVLRHYGVQSRLLDWSSSPWVATYFAVNEHDSEDGEIWAFDEPHYELKGKEQWSEWPYTTSDGSGHDIKFDSSLTAFRVVEPPDWIICAFYPSGFHRQNVQGGAYTMTARFDRPHDVLIYRLLGDPARHHRYVVAAKLKRELRDYLFKKHGIWRGSLFPDSAGAAETVLKSHKEESFRLRCRGEKKDGRRGHGNGGQPE